jgi:hypothetical protein
VSIRDREGLIARISQIRRAAGTPESRRAAPRTEDEELQALAIRITHLEQLLQGLQDSVHRESKRMGDRIAELEAQMDPATLGKALSDNARDRGL